MKSEKSDSLNKKNHQHVNIKKLIEKKCKYETSLASTFDGDSPPKKWNHFLKEKQISSKNSLLNKRQYFNLDNIPSYVFKQTFKKKGFDPNFANNQRKILTYISQLEDLRRKMIVSNALRPDLDQFLENYSFFGQKKITAKIDDQGIKKNEKYFGEIKIKKSIGIKVVNNEETVAMKNHNCMEENLELKNIVDIFTKIRDKIFKKKTDFNKVHSKIKKYIKETIDTRPANFSNLSKFLNLFFWQRSTSKSFEILSKIEKLIVWIFIVKKKLIKIPLDCFCYKQIKNLEGVETEEEDDRLINFYLKRLFRHFADFENPEFSNQNDRMIKFLNRYFETDFGEKFSLAKFTWFTNRKFILSSCKEDNSTNSILAIKDFARFLQSKEEFKHIFDRCSFFNTLVKISKSYFFNDLENGISSLVKRFFLVLNSSVKPKKVSELIFYVLGSNKVRCPFNKQEFVKAARLVLSPYDD